ncbi:MAG: hypothetical protein WDM76_12980 [Limisphaerales bacterium]
MARAKRFPRGDAVWSGATESRHHHRRRQRAGYSWEHKSIEGFSFTHLSGVGWYGDLGNFEVMPTTGPLKTERGVNGSEDGFRSRFHHETEITKAGYYAVTLDDYNVRAEMTATPRAGILRFTFPQATNRASKLISPTARRHFDAAICEGRGRSHD